MLSSVIKDSLTVSWAAEVASWDSRNARLLLPRFKGGDRQFYAAAVQLKRHGDLCVSVFWSGFAFSKGTDELIPLIHVKVKESDLLVAWECFWKQNGVVPAEVPVVAGFS